MTNVSTDNKPVFHEPVMVKEVLRHLKPKENGDGIFVDMTTSTGGHAKKIAEHLGSSGTLIGLDRDKAALEVAKKRLDELPPELKLYQANYKDLDLVLEKTSRDAVDGVLLDLGFSSFQLENPQRGFSFQNDGPLDMRMDPESGITAEDIVNTYSFEELKHIILRYGEERWADGIAKQIVKQRKEERITSTGQMVEVIRAAIPKRERESRNIHPATKTFQALRIAVNDELSSLEKGLEAGFSALKMGGVIVAISYHSLEDRRVKGFFNYKQKDCTCPPDLPVCRCSKEREIQILAEGISPTENEVSTNPRSRSARLRAGKKVAT